MKESKAFLSSAEVISREMGRWTHDKGTNFGFITDNQGNYRMFWGGRYDLLVNGVAIALINFVEHTGDIDFIDEVIDRINDILDERENNQIPLQ